MKDKYLEIFNKYELPFARCLGSKSTYRENFSNNLVIFNARIYLRYYYKIEKDNDVRDFFKGQEEEIWYGDLDLTMDIYKLWLIHLKIGEALVVTSESGNKIVEIGDSLDKHWIAQVYKDGKIKGISLKDLEDDKDKD